MSKISHRETDQENDCFAFLSNDVTQYPQGCTFGQKTRDKYNDVGGCIEGVLKQYLKLSTLCSCTDCDVTSHLEDLFSFLRKSIRVMISAESRVKMKSNVCQFIFEYTILFFSIEIFKY